jgi:polysaccharide export outer membrane protein
LISQAGGLAPNAGNVVTVSHLGGENEGAHIANASLKPRDTAGRPINLNSIMSGKDPGANAVVHAGDVIRVSTAPVVFVVGAVTKPGAFTVQDTNSRMTVLQAISMAEGPTGVASLGRTIIIRQSESEADREEIPIDLNKIMKGKEKDTVLEANDILFIPQSGLKASMRTMGQIGAQAAGYGLGLRIAP